MKTINSLANMHHRVNEKVIILVAGSIAYKRSILLFQQQIPL